MDAWEPDGETGKRFTSPVKVIHRLLGETYYRSLEGQHSLLEAQSGFNRRLWSHQGLTSTSRRALISTKTSRSRQYAYYNRAVPSQSLFWNSLREKIKCVLLLLFICTLMCPVFALSFIKELCILQRVKFSRPEVSEIRNSFPSMTLFRWEISTEIEVHASGCTI